MPLNQRVLGSSPRGGMHDPPADAAGFLFARSGSSQTRYTKDTAARRSCGEG